MSDKVERPEVLRALRLGHDEIVLLRRRVAELEPKAHAYDTIAQLAGLTIQQRPESYGVDPAWEIKSVVERIEAERNAERQEESNT